MAGKIFNCSAYRFRSPTHLNLEKGGIKPWRLEAGMFGLFLPVLNIKRTVNTSVPGEEINKAAFGLYLRMSWISNLSLGKSAVGGYLSFNRTIGPKVYEDIYYSEQKNAGNVGIINLGLALRFRK